MQLGQVESATWYLDNLVLVGLVTDLEYSEKRLASDHYTLREGYLMPTMKPSLESVESLRTRQDELCTFRDSKAHKAEMCHPGQHHRAIRNLAACPGLPDKLTCQHQKLVPRRSLRAGNSRRRIGS